MERASLWWGLGHPVSPRRFNLVHCTITICVQLAADRLDLFCLWKISQANRQCTQGTKRSLRFHRDGRRARSGLSECRDRKRARPSGGSLENFPNRGSRLASFCTIANRSQLTMRWCFGFPARQVPRARTWLNFMFTVVAPCSLHYSRRSRNLQIYGRPNRASLRGERSRTASSI